MIAQNTPFFPDENLRIGTIIEVDGTHLVAELDANIDELSRVYKGQIYPIGQFGSIVKIHYGNKLLFSYVTRLRMKSEYQQEIGAIVSDNDTRIIEADLFGEGSSIPSEGESLLGLQFQRGVTTYPLPKQGLYLTTASELKTIYEQRTEVAVPIGTYVGAGAVVCHADLNEMFGKHCAILGSTGAGKSATVASIIHSILESRKDKETEWSPHFIILDPHNEYDSAFPDGQRMVSDEGSLLLPYWLLNLNELIDLFIGKTEFQATSQTNILKTQLMTLRQDNASVVGLKADEVTVDSPIPFSMKELEKLIDEDKPSQASRQTTHLSILAKIDALKRDGRLNFLMSDWDGSSDRLVEIMNQFVGEGPSVRIIDISGIPNDVAGIVSSAVARLVFMYKLWQKPSERSMDPVVLVCEEAHKYVPDKGEAEYAAAQAAIQRIAKEGRKYGVGLVLVSQRPSEINTTVLSQCNSWFVLRLTNSQDQEYVRRFLPDSLSGLTKVLPALRRRETIFIGQAATIPARILINKLSDEKLPRSQDISFVDGWASAPATEAQIKEVGQRWRTQVRATTEGGSSQD